MDKQNYVNVTEKIFCPNILVIWTMLYIFCTYANSETILLLPILQGSHVLQITAIGEKLAQNGHQVHCVIPEGSGYLPLLQKKNISALTFQAEDRSKLLDSDLTINKTNEHIFAAGNEGFEIIKLFTKATEAHCEYMLKDERLMNRAKREKFDLAVVDAAIIGRCMFLLPYSLGIPYVAASPSLMAWDIGVPFLPSFMPAGLQLEHRGTFLDKITSLGVMLLFNSPLSPFKQNKTLLHRYAPGIQSYDVLLKRAKLFISVKDHILGTPTPKMPNVIHVPGLSYKPSQPLPATLVSRIAKDKKIIVVSFGSTAGAMPKETLRQFLDAFVTFHDCIILWKLPNTHDVILPNNVIPLPWLPQNDILGHSQTALFITHCGSNGLYEAFYHGVPLIGFPLFADQHRNARMMSNKGYGLSLDIKAFTSKQLSSAMAEILISNSNAFRNRLDKVSAILHDRDPPIDEIAYRIEHVMKYGDDHIRSVSIDMPLYELYMLDILAVLLVCIVTIVMISISFIRCLLTKICYKNNQYKLKSN